MSVKRRLAISALLTAVLIAVATEGMFVTSAPRLVSLLVEPFSLLLMPGLVVAVILAGPHDFSPISVVWIAAVFYLGFFFWALTYWHKTRHRTSR
jgi:hypothetical protein